MTSWTALRQGIGKMSSFLPVKKNIEKEKKNPVWTGRRRFRDHVIVLENITICWTDWNWNRKNYRNTNFSIRETGNGHFKNSTIIFGFVRLFSDRRNNWIIWINSIFFLLIQSIQATIFHSDIFLLSLKSACMRYFRLGTIVLNDRRRFLSANSTYIGIEQLLWVSHRIIIPKF